MLGALHLLRSFRPADRALALMLIFPTLAWLVSSLCFGWLIHAPGDPRVVTFMVLCAGLIAFSLRGALEISPGSAALPSPRS
jgi:hypothetical protein